MHDPTEIMQAAAEHALLSGAMDDATSRRDAEVAADPEWATPRWTHKHSTVTAFATGVLQADPWHRNYRPPPEFADVVACVSAQVDRHWPGEEVVQVSLVELERLLPDWADLHPAWRRWNETDKLIGISHRYSPVPEARDFIDLRAVIQCVSIVLRNQRRADDAFDRRFEAEHARGEQCCGHCGALGEHARPGLPLFAEPDPYTPGAASPARLSGDAHGEPPRA